MVNKSSDINFSQDVSTVITFDHSVNGDASPGSASTEGTFSGLYSYYDPGYATVVEATRRTRQIWIERELAPPGPGFLKGKVSGGAAIVTSRDEPNPDDGQVAADFNVQFVGDVVEDDRVPTR